MSIQSEGPPGAGAMTRRRLLRRGGGLAAALAAPGLFAACGGGGTNTASAKGLRTAVQGPAAGASPPAASGRLDFLGYEGDDIPRYTKAWRERTGVKVAATYISSESEIEAKLLGGAGGGVDLLSLTSPAAPYLIEEKLLAPIDPDKVPNLRKLWPFFVSRGKGTLLDDAGHWVAIPTYWGSIGLAWDTSVVERVDEWADILNPAFTGKVAMIDYPQLTLYAACAVLDLEPDKLTKSDLARVREYLLPIFKQVKTFTASFGDLISLLGSREVAAVFPGFTFIAGGAVAQGNKDAAYNIHLDEGYPVLIEAYALSPYADNSDAALAFINEALSPKVDAQIAEFQGAATVVRGAVPLLAKETKALYPYDDLEAFYASAKLYTNPPRKSTQFATDKDVNDMWTALKQEAKG